MMRIVPNQHEFLLAEKGSYDEKDFERHIEELKNIEKPDDFYYQIGLLYDYGINFVDRSYNSICPKLLEKEFGLVKTG